MTLLERVKLFGGKVGAEILALAKGNAVPKPDMAYIAQQGAEVAAMMGSAGWRVVSGERELQENLLMERFLTDEVKDWEQFVRLRAYVNGFRAAKQIETQIVANGISAEKSMQERTRS